MQTFELRTPSRTWSRRSCWSRRSGFGTQYGKDGGVRLSVQIESSVRYRVLPKVHSGCFLCIDLGMIHRHLKSRQSQAHRMMPSKDLKVCGDRNGLLGCKPLHNCYLYDQFYPCTTKVPRCYAFDIQRPGPPPSTSATPTTFSAIATT